MKEVNRREAHNKALTRETTSLTSRSIELRGHARRYVRSWSATGEKRGRAPHGDSVSRLKLVICLRLSGTVLMESESLSTSTESTNCLEPGPGVNDAGNSRDCKTSPQYTYSVNTSSSAHLALSVEVYSCVGRMFIGVAGPERQAKTVVSSWLINDIIITIEYLSNAWFPSPKRLRSALLNLFAHLQEKN
ncbi:hypothetical protein RRG08_028928 [Elysia crispata]|uniref:Uncharacterized protein n=1 Tax=Elysia crispata TaxID=231223 RepID=A0AAE1APR1_9GAST|nr:hypothetical protein RRG08_028928 [Elysia crispata]